MNNHKNKNKNQTPFIFILFKVSVWHSVVKRIDERKRVRNCYMLCYCAVFFCTFFWVSTETTFSKRRKQHSNIISIMATTKWKESTKRIQCIERMTKATHKRFGNGKMCVYFFSKQTIGDTLKNPLRFILTTRRVVQNFNWHTMQMVAMV